MKCTHILLPISMVLALFLSSCVMTDSVYNNSIVQMKKYRNGISFPVKESVDKTQRHNDVIPIFCAINEPATDEVFVNDGPMPAASIEADKIINQPDSNKNDYLNNLCDEIILRDGTIINGKVKEITDSKVFYTTCDNKKEEKSIDKTAVFMIKYYSGYNEVITALKDPAQTVAPVETSEVQPETEHMSSIALFLSLAGLAVGLFLSMGFGMIMSVLAFVFAITSIIIIDNSKKLKKGSGSAVAAIIISIFTVVVCMYAISLL